MRSIKMLFPTALVLLASVATAAEPDLLHQACRELEVAQIQLRRYDRIEYPLERHRLDSAIRLAEAEQESIRRRLEQYEPFSRIRYSNPLFATIEDLRLANLEAELHLEGLKKERCLLVDSRRDRIRLLQLEIDAAIERVAMLQ